MTVLEIQKCVHRAGKSLARSSLYKHFRALKLKPRGVQRPASYPDDAAQKVISRLGLNGKARR